MKLSKKTIVIGSIVVAVIIAGLITFLAVRASIGTTEKKSTDTPSFQTILPKGISIDSLGGWSRISPPENEPVFAYTDEIDGISISVSQQTLPPAFQNNTASQVSELAKRFNATSTFKAGDVTVYIGTSAKGPQSVIFTKNGLLILIKSQEKISDEAWTAYITNLQ